MLSVYVTFPDKESARRIARILVKERFLACANMFPITSIYRWKGKLIEEREWAMIGKCAKRKVKAIEQRLLKFHPYDVPCILWHDEKATPRYARWVKETLGR